MFETITALSLGALLLSVVLMMTYHLNQLTATQMALASTSETLRFLDTFFRREIHEAGNAQCTSKPDDSPFIQVYSQNDANQLFGINAASNVLMIKKCVQVNAAQYYLPILYYLQKTILYRKIVHHPREALADHLTSFDVEQPQWADISIYYAFEDNQTAELIAANTQKS